MACWLGTTLPLLWYSVVGCAVVILGALLLTPFLGTTTRTDAA